MNEEDQRNLDLPSDNGKDYEEMFIREVQGMGLPANCNYRHSHSFSILVDSVIFVWNMYSNLAKGIYDSLLKKAVLFDKEPILKVVFVYFGLIC